MRTRERMVYTVSAAMPAHEVRTCWFFTRREAEEWRQIRLECGALVSPIDVRSDWTEDTNNGPITKRGRK